MAIAHVASTAKSLGPGGGTTTAIDTTGAILIIVGVSSSSGTSSVTDSKGNTYTGLTEHFTGGTRQRLLYCLNPIVGSGHTVSTSASFSAIVVSAFSGANTYDGQENGAGGSTSPFNSGSVTPTVNNALIFVGFSASGTSLGTLTTPSGYTGGTVIPGGAANNMYACGAYLIQGTLAATNPQWTWTGSTGDAAASVAVFKEIVSTSGQISQLPVEVVILSDAPITANVSQLPVEVIVLPTPPVTSNETISLSAALF